MGQLHGGTDKHERVHIDFRIYEANPLSIQRDLGGLRIHEEGVKKGHDAARTQRGWCVDTTAD
jgi:hypothetical protein